MRVRLAIVAAAVVTLAGIGAQSAEARALSARPAMTAESHVVSLAALTPALTRDGGGSIADIPWSERAYTAATGDSVDVSVSTSYPGADDIGQRWADFFAALLHGPELALLKVYVAPLDETQSICGSSAVGCYGDDQLVLVNEPALGFDPEEVARHEYGHHIEKNRLNSPWPAIDWGPKRWATAAGICARVRSESIFPGDEFLLYRLNPGEAFAETYRFLIDTQLGQTQPAWPLVDRSFYPDQAELDAVAQDVTDPWTGPTSEVFHARLSGASVWEKRVATPLDGTITMSVSGGRGSATRIELLAPDGRKVLAATRSVHGGRLTVGAQVCGQRSVIALVTASGAPGRHVEVRVSVP
jgi:hypothetical protein